MFAAILVKNKSPLIVADIDLPEKLDYGQVLVKVAYSGICGSQINEIDAVKGEDKFLPHLLGHEGGGVVESIGPGVTRVKKGDRVVMHWRKGEGIQSATPKYKWGDRIVHAGWVTTFNQYAVVSENRITPIPKTYDLKKATLYGCALPTAFGVVHNDGQIKSGESVVIFGAGGVGSAIILAASIAGAYPIVAVDINDYKLQSAKKFGASDILDGKNPDLRKKIAKIVGGDGADITIDTTGIGKIRETCYEISSKAGRTILVGVPKKGEKICIDSFLLHFEKIITGSHGGDANPTYDIPRLIRLEEAGKFDLEKMISHIFKLHDINKAVEMVRKGNTVRCVVSNWY